LLEEIGLHNHFHNFEIKVERERQRKKGFEEGKIGRARGGYRFKSLELK
jgi:hypothetical protein